MPQILARLAIHEKLALFLRREVYQRDRVAA
jgi:hypothetical protein